MATSLTALSARRSSTDIARFEPLGACDCDGMASDRTRTAVVTIAIRAWITRRATANTKDRRSTITPSPGSVPVYKMEYLVASGRGCAAQTGMPATGLACSDAHD